MRLDDMSCNIQQRNGKNKKRSRDETTLVASIFHRQNRTVPPLINIGEEIN